MDKIAIPRSMLRARGLDVLKKSWTVGQDRWLILDPEMIQEMHSHYFNEALLFFEFSHEEDDGRTIYKMVGYRKVPKGFSLKHGNPKRAKAA